MVPLAFEEFWLKMDAAKKKRKVLTAIAKRRRGWKTARNHATNPAGRPTSFPSSSRSREEGGEGAPGAGAAPGGGTSTPTTSSAVSSEESSSAAAADSTGVASVAESASGAFLAPGCLSSEEEEDARAATRAPRVARTRRAAGEPDAESISGGRGDASDAENGVETRERRADRGARVAGA